MRIQDGGSNSAAALTVNGGAGQETRKKRGLHLIHTLSRALGSSGTKQPALDEGSMRELREACLTESRASITESEASGKITEILKRVPPSQLSEELITTLFGQVWPADDYDKHMFNTGHDSAVEYIIRQAAELHRMNFGNYTPPVHSRSKASRIFGPSVLEMSCGTGTVIKLLCENLPQEDSRNLRVIANDISVDYPKRAEEKLAQLKENHLLGSYVLTSEDIRSQSLHAIAPKRFNTAILSQTLHLITDPERLPWEVNPENVLEQPEHLTIKAKVIKDVFERMAYGDHLLIIDEWPALLTSNPISPVERLVDRLFHRTFRPVRERSTMILMMQGVADACFVAELKARIDDRHSMYGLIYRKDHNRAKVEFDGEFGKPIPGEEELQKDGALHKLVQSCRKTAIRRAYEAATAIDTHFREKHLPINGESKFWKAFTELSTGEILWYNPDTRAEVESHKKLKEKWDTIVISQMLHQIDDVERDDLIERCRSALKTGGALVFIDEWPAVGSHLIQNRKFRDLMHMHEELVFEGALRETIVPDRTGPDGRHIKGYDSGEYCYIYRNL